MRTTSPSTSTSTLAITLLAGALGAGCADHLRSQPSQNTQLPGRFVTVTRHLPGDLTRVLNDCTGRLTLAAGQGELDPRRDLLSACLMPNGALNENPLSPGDDVDEVTSRRLILVASALHGRAPVPFDEEIPATLPSYTVLERSFSPTAWILPLLDAQLRRAAVPAAARAAVLAQASALVAGSTCQLSAQVDVRFLRAGLEDFSLAWAHTDAGAPSLRLDANLDDARAVASYRIVPAFSCGGSTANPVHALLTTLLPGTFRSVYAVGGSLTLHVRLSADGQRIAGANELSLDLDGARITPPFDWVPADAWSALLTSLQVTPEGLAAAARPQVERALEPLSAQVADGLTGALALRPGERVGSVRVVDGAGGRDLSVYVAEPLPPPAAPTCQTTVAGVRICR